MQNLKARLKRLEQKMGADTPKITEIEIEVVNEHIPINEENGEPEKERAAISPKRIYFKCNNREQGGRRQ